jgi:hypothetical protein
MAKDTDRLQVTLALKTLAFLEILGSKGTHGEGDKAAARTLIEQGIRRALREGFLTEEDKKKVHNPQS